jgi:chromosomal replication initiator protein
MLRSAGDEISMPSELANNPWQLAQSHLKTALDDYSYKNWFEPTQYDGFEEGALRVRVPNQFFVNWLREHYMEVITSSVVKVLPECQKVELVAGPMNGEPGATSARPRMRVPLQGFNPRYTFDSFVIGSGNRFAHAAARAVAETPGRAYNPLFLYGDTGLGKTHLMQAIAQDLYARNPDMSCVFISSEQFTNQLIQSIAEKSTQKFRAKYRKVDILLIDDIHFIAGKEATQEEFFHTFNVLFDMHKQIVLSSDRPPKEIQGIEERLVSRFESGLVTDIQPPDLETRIAILQMKARRENASVPMEVLRFIATHVILNIRELEGALITLLGYCKLQEKRISLALAEEVLKNMIGAEKIKPVTIENVQRAVAEHFDVRIADLKGTSRQRQIVYPRQIAMFLCKEHIPSLSLNDIGNAFGGKDHTTVLYANEQVAKRSRDDVAFRNALEQLSKAVRTGQ